jgi:predicted hydrocarbon binding protein
MKEIAVPVSMFGSLRRELEKEAGTLPTVHALHHAGYQAGAEAALDVARAGRAEISSTGAEAFWSRLADFFGSRGWGSLSHSPVHDGVGVLSSPDWAEAAEGTVDQKASCCFSTGFLSGLLSELAGGPVAVLEVECRTRGGEACRFAFGSEAAIHELYGRLLNGGDLDGALSEL